MARAIPDFADAQSGPRLPLLFLLRLGGGGGSTDGLFSRRAKLGYLAGQTSLDTLAIRNFNGAQALGIRRAGLPLLQRLGGRAQRGRRCHNGECEYDAVKHRSSLACEALPLPNPPMLGRVSIYPPPHAGEGRGE